ncbi:MAG: CotH kinase family protein, partial [Flavobacteriales bacterium]|nr:CotH kinase family protein [Flavobacteriales bacterium]MCB0783163.1 CotH kinase family protein [Flavobacteriales bacterium]
QRQLVLIPAGEGPIRAKFEQVLADELGVLAPEVGFVRLVICGEDRGMFIKEERVDRTFLRKHRIMEGQLVEMGLDPWRPDQLLPASDEPSMLARTYRERSSESDAAAWTDTERLVDWALLLWLCDREDLLREGVDLVHMGVTGR